jgi:uncharacterized cupredoxin-like copper-binding protein
MTRMMRRWVALVVAVLVLGACGGGAGTGSDDATPDAAGETEATAAPTKDEWIDQAIVECEAVNAALDETEPAGDPFSPSATDEDRQQGISYLQAAADGLGTFSQNLRDFGIPEEDPEGAEAIVDAADASAEAFGEAVAAAEEDFASAQPAVGQAFGSFGPLEQAANDYGIGSLEDCQKEAAPAEEVAEGANEVPVVAVGDGETYDFEFEQPVPAGKTAFVMDNQDDEPHFMFVAKLTGDLSLDEILEAEQEGQDPDEHAEEVGGSDDAGPGEQVVLNVENLEAGTYGMLCYIPGPDGEPHAYNGMAVEFEVQ